MANSATSTHPLTSEQLARILRHDNDKFFQVTFILEGINGLKKLIALIGLVSIIIVCSVCFFLFFCGCRYAFETTLRPLHVVTH